MIPRVLKRLTALGAAIVVLALFTAAAAAAGLTRAEARLLRDLNHVRAAHGLAPPTRCTASEGDCTAKLAAVDGNERTSLTDEHDLGARETIELTMPPGTGRQGIVIGARQSLVTTYERFI